MIKLGKRRTGGRNNTGRITVRHRGGGHKRRIRLLERDERSGRIINIEYDPNRTALLAVCQGPLGEKNYKILGGIIGGDSKERKEWINKEIKVVRLKEVGVGSEIFNLGKNPGQRGGIARAAGANCKVIKQEEKTTTVRLPSGVIQIFQNENKCSIGRVWAEQNQVKEKAGYNRRRGIRPTVKGVSMNPIDHPNGGKTKGGQPKTLWGKLAKWKNTRSPRKPKLVYVA